MTVALETLFGQRQVVTPDAGGTITIPLNWSSGPNITISAIPGSSQPVGVISNVPDGFTFQIDLDGGGFSGVWPVYSSGSPSTLGYTWLGSGGVPVSTASTDSTVVIPIYGKRKGFELRLQASYPVPKP